MSERHLLIAGTGRAGTTALVELLGACGLDTGADGLRYHDSARAGLEHGLDARAPYVVKNPFLSEDLAARIAEGFDPSRLDAILVPQRDLEVAVASRLQVFIEHGIRTPGGLWRSTPPTSQRRVLAEAEHRLLLTAAEHSVPVVLLAFPRFVEDPRYAWRQLGPLLPAVEEEEFLAAHADRVRPQMVSDPPYPGAVRMGMLDVRWAVLTARRAVALWVADRRRRRRAD